MSGTRQVSHCPPHPAPGQTLASIDPRRYLRRRLGRRLASWDGLAPPSAALAAPSGTVTFPDGIERRAGGTCPPQRVAGVPSRWLESSICTGPADIWLRRSGHARPTRPDLARAPGEPAGMAAPGSTARQGWPSQGRDAPGDGIPPRSRNGSGHHHAPGRAGRDRGAAGRAARSTSVRAPCRMLTRGPPGTAGPHRAVLRRPGTSQHAARCSPATLATLTS